MEAAVRRSGLTEIEERTYLAIVSKDVSLRGLADLLTVSSMTAARAVAGLRRKGIRIVAVRERGRWHYEIPDWKRRERDRWRRSRLRRMIGFVKTWKPMSGKSEDEILYEED